MKQETRFCLTALTAASILLFAAGVKTDDKTAPPVRASKSGAVFLEAVGNADPSGPFRIAQKTDFESIRVAMYGSERNSRLVAIDTAAFVEDPWPLLPYLAALMGARDRQTSSRAAHSFISALSRITGDPWNRLEAIAGQARQLAGQLASLAADARLDVDIRASSITGIMLLRAYDRALGLSDSKVSALLDDEDMEIRRAALATIRVPASRSLLSRLVEIAGPESAPTMRGQAADLLCENALSQGAKAPSKDLAKILSQVLGDAAVPAEGIAPILACLARFPVETRADLWDVALRHPDPAVAEFAKTLSGK
jgi:hypothetical protein